jgi:ribosomal protein L34E
LVTVIPLTEASRVLAPAPLLADGFPVAVNTLHRLEVTPEDSIGMLRMKVPEYAEKTDAEMLHIINRFFNGFKGEHSNHKGLTILPVGTYMVDIVDHLQWEAGDFGDQHSCYWQGYGGERRRMGQEGVWALRVHYSPKHRNYITDKQEENIETIQAAYPEIPRIYDDNGYDRYNGNDGSRAMFVPWWRLAERPGIALEKAADDGVQPDVNDQARRGGRFARHPDQAYRNRRIVPETNVAGWQQAFGGRWVGDRRTAIMHNPYGSLHLPQLSGIYAKLTGLLPNNVSPGIATFGDAKPDEYDWIFNRHDYMYNHRRVHGRGRCAECGQDISYRAARPMKIQRVGIAGERYGPAALNGVWCMDCVVTHARRSPKSDRWTRTRGVKWNA